MLPRWSSQLSVALAPTAVDGALWSGGWSARPRRHVNLLCSTAGDAPEWRPALDTLGGWVKALGLKRMPVRVVLSNHFVRYMVVPWTRGVAGRSERLGLARHLFRQNFGEAAADWNVQLSSGRYGESALACAVDEGLLAGLRESFAPGKLKCSSVQPLLAFVFNRFRKQIGDDAYLLVVEPGRLCCAVIHAGQWRALHTAQRPADMSIARLIERQLGLMAVDARMPVYVFDATGEGVAKGARGRWRALVPSGPRRVDPTLLLLEAA